MVGNTVLATSTGSLIEMLSFVLLFLLLDNPKFSWKKTFLAYSIYTSAFVVIGKVWVSIDIVSFSKFCTLTIFAGALLLFPLMSSHNPFQVFYNLSLQIFILIMQIVVAVKLSMGLCGGNQWADIVFRLLYLAVAGLCYKRWLRKQFREISDIGIKSWVPISVISILGNLFIIYYWTRPHFLMLRSSHEQVVFVCIWSLLFVTHLIMIQSLTRMKREIAARSAGELSAITSRMLQRQLEILEESVQEARRIRHDVRHHNMLIAEYAEKGENRQLLDYLGEYEKEAESHVATALCENLAANNILNAYIQKAKQHGIDVRLNVSLEQETTVSDLDLVAILANIMENAIHGCLHSDKNNPFIELYIGKKISKLIIHARNTAGNDVTIENGLPKSKNGTGIGISSILSSTAQYGGEHYFEMENGEFSCELLLKVEK